MLSHNAPRAFLHNPMFVKLVLFYPEGQCRKNPKHATLRNFSGLFSSATGFASLSFCLSASKLQMTPRAQGALTNARLSARRTLTRRCLPERRKSFEIGRAKKDQMVSIKRGVKLPQMLRGGRRSADMAVGRRGDW